MTGAFQAAAEACVNYWNGAGAWEALWPEARERAVARLPRAALDFLALIEHAMPETAYGFMRCPVRIVRGEHARSASRLIAEELTRLLPLASLEVLPGAGHMGPLSHPGEVNRTIVGFIRANPARMAGLLSATPIAA